MNKNNNKGISYGFVSGIVILSMVAYMSLSPSVHIEEWHVVFTAGSASAAENDAGSSGWLATFLYNQSEDPDQMNNGTWFESASNVSGYVENDGGQDEVTSESGSYIVVRCKFNKDQCYDGDDSQWVHTRTKCHMTITGSMDSKDFTDQPLQWGLQNNSVANDSTATNLYINFWKDDGGGYGYAVPDDGRLSWNITVYAKY